jgi:uncharacterized protein (DUF1778 family)
MWRRSASVRSSVNLFPLRSKVRCQTPRRTEAVAIGGYDAADLELQGRTLTDFVVTAAREAAWRAIEEAEIIRLSIEDQRRIAEAILNPPKRAPALRRAFKRRRQLFGSS